MSNRGSCMMHPETRMEGSEKGKHREGLFLSMPLLSFPEVRPCRGLASRWRCQGPRGQGQASCLLHLSQTGGLGLRVLENSDLIVNFAAQPCRLQ